MLEIIKKILMSKYFRLAFSAILIYFVFRRINIVSVIGEIKQVPIWFVVAMVIYNFVGGYIWSVRWAMLLIKKPGFKDVYYFFKSSTMAGFYGILIPSIAGVDAIKWLLSSGHNSRFRRCRSSRRCAWENAGLPVFCDAVAKAIGVNAGRRFGFGMESIVRGDAGQGSSTVDAVNARLERCRWRLDRQAFHRPRCVANGRAARRRLHLRPHTLCMRMARWIRAALKR